ncbi:MAG: hypothetical protein AMXMBFR13_25990 [Phycisphaerae bacterium]
MLLAASSLAADAPARRTERAATPAGWRQVPFVQAATRHRFGPLHEIRPQNVDCYMAPYREQRHGAANSPIQICESPVGNRCHACRAFKTSARTVPYRGLRAAKRPPGSFSA